MDGLVSYSLRCSACYGDEMTAPYRTCFDAWYAGFLLCRLVECLQTPRSISSAIRLALGRHQAIIYSCSLPTVARRTHGHSSCSCGERFGRKELYSFNVRQLSCRACVTWRPWARKRPETHPAEWRTRARAKPRRQIALHALGWWDGKAIAMKPRGHDLAFLSAPPLPASDFWG